MAVVIFEIPLLVHNIKGKYAPPANPAITPYLLPKAMAITIGKINNHGILMSISPTLASKQNFENNKPNIPDSIDITIIF